MKKLIIIVMLICLAFAVAPAVHGATIDWKNVTWDLQNATAVINGDGSLTLTSLVNSSSGVGLHANRLSGTFENIMDPWIQWSFTGHTGDILIDKEETIQPGNPTIGAGSLWDTYWAVTRYTAVGGSRPEQYIAGAAETSNPISHVVNIGKRTDGTVDAKFDSNPWAANEFLKTNVGGNWGFQDVSLRMRAAAINDTITFNNFQYGSGFVPEPATIAVLSLGGLLLRRKKTA